MSKTGSRSSPAAARLVETIKRWKLFDHQDQLLVAVSGGVDSVVLLHLLLHLPKPLRPELHVAHFNHKLRGRESDADAVFVKKLAVQSGVSYHEGRAPRWKDKSNLEARARDLRYAFLRKTALKEGIETIVTAHHADDQAETFIMHWLKGAGLRGLAGIPMVRRDGDCRLLRPLLLISRDSILAYAKENQITYRNDSSNKDLSLTRNRVRKWLRQLKKLNPNLPETTALNTIILQSEQGFIDKQVKGLMMAASSFSRVDYRGLDPGMRYRVLQELMGMQGGGPLKSDIVMKLDDLAMSSAPCHQFDLPHGMTYKITRNDILLLPKKSRKKSSLIS